MLQKSLQARLLTLRHEKSAVRLSDTSSAQYTQSRIICWNPTIKSIEGN